MIWGWCSNCRANNPCEYASDFKLTAATFPAFLKKYNCPLASEKQLLENKNLKKNRKSSGDQVDNKEIDDQHKDVDAAGDNFQEIQKTGDEVQPDEVEEEQDVSTQALQEKFLNMDAGNLNDENNSDKIDSEGEQQDDKQTPKQEPVSADESSQPQGVFSYM